MARYLHHNKSLTLCKVIFGARSGTLEIKDWNLWKHDDNICVKCDQLAETMSYFTTCKAYGKETHINNWKYVYENTQIFSMI